MSNSLIFEGQNRIRYDYARYGYTRGGGTIWHGGADVEGLDSKVIRMPWYHATPATAGKSITGTVRTARIVTNKSNKTWEWGWYVAVEMASAQTPDKVNWLYFCHCAQLLVEAGQTVKSGDALAIMGNTGNAALASPPYEHLHFEVRATATGKGLDPTAYLGFSNAVGTYGTPPQTNEATPNTATVLVDGLRLRTLPSTDTGIQVGSVEKGHAYDVMQQQDDWAYLLTGTLGGGWAATKSTDGKTPYIQL